MTQHRFAKSPLFRTVTASATLDFVGEAIEKPSWAVYLEDLGHRLAELPTVEYGEPTAHVALSVPTGRFTYWFLTAGALLSSPVFNDEFGKGDVVTTWLTPPFRITDVELEDAESRWRLSPLDLREKSSFVGVRTPPDAPENRRATRMPQAVRDGFRELTGKGAWHPIYSKQCLRPIAIIGSGREYIQDQRRTLLREVPHWFAGDTRSLLSRETTHVFDPDQMLFHPYMILDAKVGASRPWILPLEPRLTIVTSWSSFSDKSAALFSRRPQVVVCNRRVKRSATLITDLDDFTRDQKLQSLVEKGLPPGLEAYAFTRPAEAPLTDDFDEGEGII